MKRVIKTVALALCICALFLLPGCAAPFSFALRWDPGGSSYDSTSGILVKTNRAQSPDQFRTVLKLSREEIDELAHLAEAVDFAAIPEAPESYDPFSSPENGPYLWSKPAFSLELELRDGQGGSHVRQIRCPSLPPAFFSMSGEDLPEPFDENGKAFEVFIRRAFEIILNSEEWLSLPPFGIGYQ